MSRPSWLIGVLRSVSPWLWGACLSMWMCAVAVTTVGVLGDTAGWWVAWPFLSNFLSEVAAAFFGVPFALIVVQRVSAVEGERYTRR
jgi:hypothetical protein